MSKDQHLDDYLQELLLEQDGEIGLKLNQLEDSHLSMRAQERWNQELKKLPRYAEKKRAFRLSKILPIAAIVVVLSTLLTLASPLQTDIKNFWVEQIASKFVWTRMADDPDTVMKAWRDVLIPTALPDGFSLLNAIDGAQSKMLEYTDANGNLLVFSQHSPDASIARDLENVAQPPTQIATDVYIYEKDGECTLYWHVGNRAFSIVYGAKVVSQNAVVRMATSAKSPPGLPFPRQGRRPAPGPPLCAMTIAPPLP